VVFQVRIHGRGGQGVVTAAEMLSIAAFTEGRYAQAFPIFGSERTGAPVMAFCRIDDAPIRLREPVADPDALIVQDATLLRSVDLFAGLRPGGYMLLNSVRSWAELGLSDVVARLPAGHARIIPASGIALAHVGRPLPNAALLGGFAALTGLLSLDSVRAAIRERFAPRLADANAAAATEAYHAVAPIGEVSRG
jgi:pyruvate ferredoxin oxidoreductase gamma subunit